MRMFMGMIFGCLLTVAAVYVHDSMATPVATNGTQVDSSRTIVNWDVAARKWGEIRETANLAWRKLQSIDSPPPAKGA